MSDRLLDVQGRDRKIFAQRVRQFGFGLGALPLEFSIAAASRPARRSCSRFFMAPASATTANWAGAV
jgi:hypothetical protein